MEGGEPPPRGPGDGRDPDVEERNVEEAPPAAEKPKPKRGFLGKTAKKKFGRNKRAGSWQKSSRRSAQAASPPPREPPAAVAAVPEPERKSRRAARKETKSEVESKLGYEQRERRNAQKQVAEARRETARFAKKAERLSMEKARMAEHAQSSQARARAEKKRADGEERKCAALQKEMEEKEVVQQQKHEVSMAKMAAAKDEEHRSELKRSAKRKERDHKIELAAAEKAHAAQLSDAQMQSMKHQQVAEENRREAEKAHAANRKLRRDHQAAIDELKIAHRDDIKRRQTVHLRRLEDRKGRLDEKQEVLEAARGRLHSKLQAIRSHKRDSRIASRKMEAAKEEALKRLASYQSAMVEVEQLKTELEEERLRNEELRGQIDEYGAALDLMEHEYGSVKDEYASVVEFVNNFHQYREPRIFQKEWVKNATRGAHQEWPAWVDKLIIEMHANRTPPTCIQANILAFSRTVFPDQDIVLELPSLKHIRSLRQALRYVTKALAGRTAAQHKSWKQLHTDETGRRKTQLVSVVVSMLGEDDELKSVCLHADLIAKDGTAESQSRAIIASFGESGRLLDEWAEEAESMFPGSNLRAEIGSSADLDVTKLLRGFVTGDNCSTARSIRQKLHDMIIAIGREKGIPEDRLRLFESSCFNHLRCTWSEAGEGYLSKELQDVLKYDLEMVPPHVRIDLKLMNLLRMVDKQVNETCNYAKGKGHMYQHRQETFHPGKRCLPIVRVLGGARQDASFEGALPVYDGRHDIMTFVLDQIESNEKENLLETSLFMMLGCMEVTAVLRIASIYHLAVVLPMRWLAGKTHELAGCGWGERSMGKAVDLLYAAMEEIQADGTKMLDHDFVMNIFRPLYAQVPALEGYLEHYLQEKESNVIGSVSKDKRCLGYDECQEDCFIS